MMDRELPDIEQALAPMERAPEVIVLGLGNRLRRDEGLGVCALERLYQRYTLPPNVQLVDGGVLGLELLTYVEQAQRLLVLDATFTGSPPGELLKLEDEEAPAYLGMRASDYETDLPDLLAVARRTLASVIILGMQPASTEPGWGLSRTIATRLDLLADAAARQLSAWGYVTQPRQPSGSTGGGASGEEQVNA